MRVRQAFKTIGSATALVAVFALFGGGAGAVATPADTTQLIDRPTGTGPGPTGGTNHSLGGRQISSDGRYVAFVSQADALSDEDDDRFFNVFLRDTVTGTTTLVSRGNGADGAAADRNSRAPAVGVAPNGDVYVAFASRATNLDFGAPGASDTNGKEDVYLRNVTQGTTDLVSRNDGGVNNVDLGNGDSNAPSIGFSVNAVKVAFQSSSTNFDTDDNGASTDVWVRNTATNQTTLVSVGATPGHTGNATSLQPMISADGTKVAFASRASDVTGVNNNQFEIVVRDLGANTTTLVSRTNAAMVEPANDDCFRPAIDSDGSTVAFEATATNLDAADTNGKQDIYMRSGTTTLVSRATGAGGAIGNNDSFAPSISGDGKKVVFATDASNFGDGNAVSDVYARDLSGATPATKLVSRASGPDGAVGDDYSEPFGDASPAISADGSKVAFTSFADNLSSDDDNDFAQVFLRELGGTERTILVSRGTGEAPELGSIGTSTYLAEARGISADGRFVAFMSQSNGLSDEDDDRFFNAFVRDTLTDTTTLVSRGPGPAGPAANGDSYFPTMSPDGRFVVFASQGTNLLNLNTGGHLEVYVRDLVTGAVELVSQANGFPVHTENAYGMQAAVSSDGSKIAFITASAVDPADTNGKLDVYVRNRTTGLTTLVSRKSGTSGAVGAEDALNPTISDDGKRIAFETNSTLDADDNDNHSDIYVRDLRGAEPVTLLASRNSAGEKADNASAEPSISGDGNEVAFDSYAKNLSPDDTNNTVDVYVRNLAAGTTVLASRATGAAGAVGDSYSDGASLSGDGTRVAFSSAASNLSSDDTNAPVPDVYVRDLAATTTTLASRQTGPGGAVGTGPSAGTSLSENGDCLAFNSIATNLGSPSPDYFRVYMRTVSRECPADPPDTTIDAGPGDLSASSSATFAFSASQAGSTFTCSLDGAAFAPCSSPHTVQSLADGAHTFAVRAKDPAAYEDATPAARLWTVDTSAPETTIRSGPSGLERSTSAAFEFDSSETRSTFACSLDGAAFAACASPRRLNGLAQGKHTFRVRATDQVGNVDAIPASRSWTVDTIAPRLKVKVPHQTRRAVRARGARERVQASEPCNLTVELLLGRKVVGRRVVYVGTRRKTIVVKAKRRLRGSAKLKLRTRARDTAGNVSVVTRPIR